MGYPQEELKYNEQGYAFVLDKDLTKYAQRDTPYTKGLPKNYVVLQVHKKEIGLETNILFDTATQLAIDELGIGESCWAKIDFHKVANGYEHDKH